MTGATRTGTVSINKPTVNASEMKAYDPNLEGVPGSWGLERGVCVHVRDSRFRGTVKPEMEGACQEDGLATLRGNSNDG